MSLENARFRKIVVPGDTLRVHATKIHKRGNVWKFRGEAKVGANICAEAVYTAMIVNE
jgi:3-hydroxyacyl-[acyl-carrier-protein] dehydratase